MTKGEWTPAVQECGAPDNPIYNPGQLGSQWSPEVCKTTQLGSGQAGAAVL